MSEAADRRLKGLAADAHCCEHVARHADGRVPYVILKQRALAKRLPRPEARELVRKVGRAPRDHLWQDELRRVGQRLLLNRLHLVHVALRRRRLCGRLLGGLLGGPLCLGLGDDGVVLGLRGEQVGRGERLRAPPEAVGGAARDDKEAVARLALPHNIVAHPKLDLGAPIGDGLDLLLFERLEELDAAQLLHELRLIEVVRIRHEPLERRLERALKVGPRDEDRMELRRLGDDARVADLVLEQSALAKEGALRQHAELVLLLAARLCAQYDGDALCDHKEGVALIALLKDVLALIVGRLRHVGAERLELLVAEAREDLDLAQRGEQPAAHDARRGAHAVEQACLALHVAERPPGVAARLERDHLGLAHRPHGGRRAARSSATRGRRLAFVAMHILLDRPHEQRDEVVDAPRRVLPRLAVPSDLVLLHKVEETPSLAERVEVLSRVLRLGRLELRVGRQRDERREAHERLAKVLEVHLAHHPLRLGRVVGARAYKRPFEDDLRAPEGQLTVLEQPEVLDE